MKGLAQRAGVALAGLLAVTSCNCEGLDITDVPGTLVGTLCDARTGAGGSGVEMSLSLPTGGTKKATSEGGGQVHMDNVPPGIYSVSLTQRLSDGSATQRVINGVEIKSSQETTLYDPACLAANQPPGTGWITGRVCNRHTGSWVTQADVSLLLSSGEIATTTTDEEGHFLLERVPVGDHVLYVRSTDYSRSYEVTVSEGRETSLDAGGTCQGLDANSGGVEGVLCAPNGTGSLAGATAYVEVGTPGVRLSDITDADGHFIITGLPPGNHELHVTQGAYNRTYLITIVANQLANIGPGVCPMPAQDTGGVEGYFCNATSNGPLVDGVVTVNTNGGPLEDTTDAQGRFEFGNLVPGAYTVEVHSASTNASYPVTVVAGQVTQLVPQQDCGFIGGPSGEIHGRVCAPNGTTWLANARVWVDIPSGGEVETQTAADGRFVLAGVPPGIYTLHVAAGSFTVDIPNVEVRPNEITDIGDGGNACVPIENDRNIAVVSGSYDAVQVVLDRLGLTNVTMYTGEDGAFRTSLLTDYALMQTYDVIFFNCGVDDSFLDDPGLRATAVANLRQYVASGKSVYASDWAYDVVEQAWPSYVDFYGDDLTIDSAQMMRSADNSVGNVVDPGLRNALGTQQVSINFNLDAWAAVSAVGLETRVYIRGNAEACDDVFCFGAVPLTSIPYTVGFHPGAGAGKVIYTSFHQEQQTTQDMDLILQLLIFEL